MKSLRFLIPLFVLAVLLAFLAAGLKLNPREVPSPLIGKPAPGFNLARLDDPTQNIKREDMHGKVWMLNVWASWCVACRQEHPLLVEFSRRKLLPVLGLNYKDQRPDGLGWLGQFGNPYDASLYDIDGRVGIDFGVYGVPETFIIDREGVIRMKHIGPLTPEVIQTEIEPMVRKLNG
jgi:cytochrome c biogenesis protein CcmG/thiol:disulfide interchange protein DsbE